MAALAAKGIFEKTFCQAKLVVFIVIIVIKLQEILCLHLWS
jgi:hypothetical protein